MKLQKILIGIFQTKFRETYINPSTLKIAESFLTL